MKTHNGKLSEEQVKEIRRDYERFPGKKSLKYFSKKFGVSYRCVSEARRGKNYKWVSRLDSFKETVDA